MTKTVFAILAISAVFTAFLAVEVRAECHVCQSNRVACRNETHYSVCFSNNLPDPRVHSCPPGTVCSSDASVCSPRNSSGIRPSCTPEDGCGVCDSSKTFACVSQTQVALCFGRSTYSTLEYFDCPTWTYCNVAEMNLRGDICVPICGEGSQPTCVSLEPIEPGIVEVPEPAPGIDNPIRVPETSTPLTPREQCNSLYNEVGVFPFDGDATCKRYIYCGNTGAGLNGNEASCPEYFDKSIRRCTKMKPSDC